MPCCSGPAALASNVLSLPRALALRRARQLCATLRSAYGEDDTAPLNVLANCEEQLLFLESWLLGKKSGKPQGTLARSKEVVRKQLALPAGLASQAAEKAFVQTFSPPEGEVLAQVFECSAKSLTCFLPGSLFVTTNRLCFCTGRHAVKSSASLAWQNVQRIRVMLPNIAKEDNVVQGIFVRMQLQETIEFDGLHTDTFEFITFDPAATTILQRCSDSFSSKGAYQEIVAEKGDGLLSKEEMMKINSTDIIQLERTNAVFQLQRRTAILLDDWQRPFLPIDASVGFATWMALDEASSTYTFHPLLSTSQSCEDNSESPPIESMFALGCNRKCEWQAVKNDKTDDDGWQYAGLSFSGEPTAWHNSCGPFSLTRRRLWIAEFPDANAGPSQIPRNTLLELQCKQTQEVFTGDLGKLPLATLAEWLQADDWTTEGSLMAEQLKDQGSTELDIEAWQDREGQGQAKRVHGKLRNIKMRVPVPPAPMCPPTTRVEQVCHVFVEESRVLRETSTLSLDVPYGTCFKTVIQDCFTVVDGDSIKMTRSFGLEWVQSTMMKGMIESNVPPNLKLDAEALAAFLRQWISNGGKPGGGAKSKEGGAKSKEQGGAKSKDKGSGKPKSAPAPKNQGRQWILCCSDTRSTEDEISTR
eukprot:TRINITY_DN73597_c0_g1_i1.p1 TRINITY_DN73597_c0_g1~~TRINITY_DN73597_c0_g1_i1.p1  ORF type:complete len:643 (-),score=126.06 TRINITY_DN73597_c0_g1_i1:429-2357(-)